MNKDRLKRISEAQEHLSRARALLEIAHDEEQEAYENLPESLQMSERGQKMEFWMETMDNAVSDLDDMESSLEECKA